MAWRDVPRLNFVKGGVPMLVAAGSSEVETEPKPVSDRFRDFDDFVPQNFTLPDAKIDVQQILENPFSSTMA